MTTTINNEHKKLNFSSEREQSQTCLNSAEHEKNQGRKVLNVPNLRFKEFQGEWEVESIKDVADFMGGGTPSSSNESFWQGTIPWVSSSDIVENDIKNICISRYITEEAIAHSATKLCPAPSILIVSRVGVGKIALSKEAICTSQDFCNLINIKVEPVFLTYCLSQIMKRKSMEVQGTSIKGITTSEIQKISINIPSLQEQKKIGKILSLLDERIATQSKVIDKLQSLIKGIMANLQKRGLKNNTWGKISLCDVLAERKELNKQLYPVFSVSVSQGVINQIEYLGRSFAAKDTSKYHVVYCGDIIYTKSPTGDFPYGIVKQNYNQEKVAVSPLYGVYVPKSFSIGVFLHEYFKSNVNTYNYLHPLIQKGAKNTINITNLHFLENKVAMPLVEQELVRISNLILSLNAKVMLMQHLKDKYERQKQYMLRQMFV